MTFKSTRIIRLKARLATKETQLSALNDLYDDLVSKSLNEYVLNTGEGMQKGVRVRLEDVEKQITKLESQIDFLYRRIYTTGLIRFTVKRFSNT